jgi:hypothetical protein
VKPKRRHLPVIIGKRVVVGCRDGRVIYGRLVESGPDGVSVTQADGSLTDIPMKKLAWCKYDRGVPQRLEIAK